MSRQSLFMLIGAAFLALVAVFVARAAFSAKAAPAAPTTFAVVAAAKPLTFGDKITPDALKLVELPASAIPQGAFRKLDAARRRRHPRRPARHRGQRGRRPDRDLRHRQPAVAPWA